jgi:hypothetical protein
MKTPKLKIVMILWVTGLLWGGIAQGQIVETKVTTSPAAGVPWVALRGDAGADRVKLLWQPKEWPKDLKGFVVKRRPVVAGDQEGLWEEISTTIVPGISPTKFL